MKLLLMIGAAFAAMCAAQSAAPSTQTAAEEEESLRRAVTDGSTSTVDLMRALEAHLAQYPQSARKADIERALAKAAIDNKDERRIALYGNAVLVREPDDLPTLDRVTQALIVLGGEANLKQALGLAQRYEKLLQEMLAKPAASGAEKARRQEEIDRALSRAILSQAIATGNLGNAAAAVELGRKSFTAAPGVEAAAEIARRLAQLGRNDEAVRAYADAFALADTGATAAERAAIRRLMGEVYRKSRSSEAGLGDIVLEAFDRNAKSAAARKLALREFDPNNGLSNPMDFTLTGINGDKLPMASLRGKAVVLDFWATWCGPCRAQHPLYEDVKKRFEGREDVIFLFINTDEEREIVKPFLDEQGWDQSRIYYEDGLSRTLRVTSIPTTVVFGRTGGVVSRMNGFDPARFVDMLTERINDALK